MGMSTHVLGIKPADETWSKMFDVWKACVRAGIDQPKEVGKFFNFEAPDQAGVLIDLEKDECHSKWGSDGCSGHEIDLTKLPEGVSKIRFYNSW